MATLDGRRRRSFLSDNNHFCRIMDSRSLDTKQSSKRLWCKDQAIQWQKIDMKDSRTTLLEDKK